MISLIVFSDNYLRTCHDIYSTCRRHVNGPRTVYISTHLIWLTLFETCSVTNTGHHFPIMIYVTQSLYEALSKPVLSSWLRYSCVVCQVLFTHCSSVLYHLEQFELESFLAHQIKRLHFLRNESIKDVMLWCALRLKGSRSKGRNDSTKIIFFYIKKIAITLLPPLQRPSPDLVSPLQFGGTRLSCHVPSLRMLVHLHFNILALLFWRSYQGGFKPLENWFRNEWH